MKHNDTTVADVLAACHRWAPPELAWEKDNIGLIAGDPAATVGGVLLSCDLSTPVVAEAVKREANVVIVHHPPIFAPVKSLRTDAPRQAALLAAIRNGLHVIAMHTNYDAAAEGVNDVLAALVGLADVRPLCPDGIVRIGRLAKPATVAALVERIKPALKVETIGVIGPLRRRVKTVAVCGGGCGDDMLAAAIAAEVDLFITGEMSHDCAVAAVEAGLSCLLAGHWHTERPAMAALAPRLATAFPAVPVHVSRKDAAPISYL